jgi:hypothetical protein
MNKLFNPFKYIAGWESLFLGLAILLTTAVVGYFSQIHFPDLISVKTIHGLPFWVIAVQSVSNWFILSLLLYLAALILSPSSVRIIDVFGTQAMARFPYLLAAFTGFSGSIEKFGQYMLWSALHTGDPVQISTGEMTAAIILILASLLLTIWMITLMFNAFSVSTNLKGAKLIVPFIVLVITSIIVTGFISSWVIKIVVT